MIVNDIEVMFGGQAGDGSLTTGDLIAGVFKRMGLEVYTYKDFPSRIRGGHTNYVIRAGTTPELRDGRLRRLPGRVRPRSRAAAHRGDAAGRLHHLRQHRRRRFRTSTAATTSTSYEIPIGEDRQGGHGARDRAQHDLARRPRQADRDGSARSSAATIDQRLRAQEPEGRRHQHPRDRSRRELRRRALRLGPTGYASRRPASTATV